MQRSSVLNYLTATAYGRSRKRSKTNRLGEQAQPRLRVVGLLPLGVEVAVDFPDEAAIGTFSLCSLVTEILAGAFQ